MVLVPIEIHLFPSPPNLYEFCGFQCDHKSALVISGGVLYLPLRSPRNRPTHIFYEGVNGKVNNVLELKKDFRRPRKKKQYNPLDAESPKAHLGGGYPCK